MEEKVFKTYDEMLAILESRGVDLSSPQLRGYAKRSLQHQGYYNLINGYKMLFLLKGEDGGYLDPDQYKSGTTINEIYALYFLDNRLRAVFLKNILHIEINIKNLISYTFSERHGHQNYLIYNNFDTKQRDCARNITSLIAEIQRQISSRVSDPSISHYLRNHGYIPLWVLNNILTLGTISKFYSLMKQPERQEVAKIFSMQEHELVNALLYLSSIRNICAHNNRLYCYRTKRPLIDLKMHTILHIPQNNNHEFEYGKRDLFACMILFKIMLPKNMFRNLIKEIDQEFADIQGKLHVLSGQEILDCMGFPADWKEKLLELE